MNEELKFFKGLLLALPISILLWILIICLVSCSNSNLYELGMERTYYVDATTGRHIETTWGPRNIWAWPSIILFYPIALIYDLGEIGVKKIVEWIRKKPP